MTTDSDTFRVEAMRAFDDFMENLYRSIPSGMYNEEAVEIIRKMFGHDVAEPFEDGIDSWDE